jgi:hypothetical protein
VLLLSPVPLGEAVCAGSARDLLRAQGLSVDSLQFAWSSRTLENLRKIYPLTHGTDPAARLLSSLAAELDD